MANTSLLDRFSPSTRDALERSKVSVAAFKHSHITPEHLLLGMLESSDATLSKALALGKAKPAQLKILVQRHLRLGEYEIAADQLTFSERAKRVLETAREESVRAQNPQIGPEHLLLGLIRVRNTVASAVLAAVDLDADGVRAELARH